MIKIILPSAALVLSALANPALALPSHAQAANESLTLVADSIDRHPSLETIVQNWDQYGFTPPTKPAQMIVKGRDGITISGVDYAAAVSILRSRPSLEGRSIATRLWLRAR